MDSPIYADYNASCPVTRKHYKEIEEALINHDGNPSGVHYYGREAKNLLEDSRQEIATWLGSSRHEIYFTSGATESNNLILRHFSNKSFPPQVIITAGEHASIRVPAQSLNQKNMIQLTVSPITSQGLTDYSALKDNLSSKTKLVCLVHVNNEIGSINDIEELAHLVKTISPQAWVHSDMVQGLGKIPIPNLSQSSIDSASFSAHKIGGFKGIGCLYVKSGQNLSSQIEGGGQEMGLRSGTENLPGAVSFGLRAKSLRTDPNWLQHLENLSQDLSQKMQDIKGLILHSPCSPRLTSTFNVYIQDVSIEMMILNFEMAGISVSAGSSCSSGTTKPSAILKAMGLDDHHAANSIRISLGPESTQEHVDKIIKTLQKCSRTT